MHYEFPSIPEEAIPQGDYILVVDNHEELAVEVANILKEHGYPVEVTYNGEEAWDMMCVRLPLLVITNDLFPDTYVRGGQDSSLLDGLVLGHDLMVSCRSYLFRNKTAKFHIPIFFLGNWEPELGMIPYYVFDEWFTRPFNPEALIDAVSKNIEFWHGRKANPN